MTRQSLESDAADGDTEFQIYFWEPSISPHKMALAESLASASSVKSVTYIADADLSTQRLREGWSVIVPPTIQTFIAPDRTAVKDLVAMSSHRSVHFFSGLRHVDCILQGLSEVTAQGRRFGLLSEPRASEGIKGLARFVQSWLTEGRLRQNADFVLAIGRNGPPWFRATGYSPNRVFPFAYFLPDTSPRPPSRPKAARENTVRVVFVGRLTREKGIDLFLEATESLPSGFEIHVAGVGKLIDQVQKATKRNRRPVHYHATIPMPEIPAFLAGMDVLVLPSISTNDGWGAVVSEALLAGLAVVTTAKVGASVCICDGTLGRIMQQLTSTALATEIEWLVRNDRLTHDYRTRRQMWARKHLTGHAGAEYLLKILAHVFAGGPKPAPFYQDRP